MKKPFVWVRDPEGKLVHCEECSSMQDAQAKKTQLQAQYPDGDVRVTFGNPEEDG